MRGRWFAAAALLLLLAPGVAAHAVLLSSEPVKGTRLDEAPSHVSVTLTEPTDPDGTTLQVLDAEGARVDLGDLTNSGGSRPTLRVSLPQDLPDGAYRIAWQALSGTDGHTTRGTVGFAVGDFNPPASEDSDPQSVHWLGAAGRSLAFLGLALAFGAAVFLAWVPGTVAVPRRPALEALLLGAGLHLLGVVLLLKSTMEQAGLSDADLASTSVGKVLLLRVGLGVAALAFAAIASLPRVPARGPPYVAVLLLAGSAFGSARFGHASLMGLAGIVVDAMHLLAAATWVGGLLVFLWLLLDAPRNGWTGDVVRLAGVRFGTVALVCVILLLAAGVGTTLAILGTEAWKEPGVTLASSWGKVLAGKVLLTLGMLGLATINRFGILAPAAAGGFAATVQKAVTRVAPRLRVLDDGAHGMRRLLGVEATLGVAALALAAVLTSVSPPMQTALDEGTFEAIAFGSDFHGVLAADPLPVAGGTSDLLVHIETHFGDAVDVNSCGRAPPASCVTAVIGDEGGETHFLQPQGGGDWSVAGILWTTAGDVTVAVTVSTSEVFEDTLAFDVVVRPNA